MVIRHEEWWKGNEGKEIWKWCKREMMIMIRDTKEWQRRNEEKRNNIERKEGMIIKKGMMERGIMEKGNCKRKEW